LLKAGLIKSAMIRVGGSSPGRRLYDLDSVRRYLKSCECSGDLDLSPSPRVYKQGSRERKRPVDARRP
jgi:hypothetical protein